MPDESSSAPDFLDAVARETDAPLAGTGAGDAPERESVSPALPAGTLVAACVDDRHPDLTGRVRIAWRPGPDADELEAWVPVLQTVTVRVGDRVLLTRAANWPEPVVVGVVDGFARRPEAEPVSRPTVELPDDEALRIVDRRGRPLLEIRSGLEGAELRLLDDDATLRVPGRFRIEAGTLDLRAVDGGV